MPRSSTASRKVGRGAVWVDPGSVEFMPDYCAIALEKFVDGQAECFKRIH